ncbi:sensor histidine kinase, partial [Sesbania bispinosa]
RICEANSCGVFVTVTLAVVAAERTTAVCAERRSGVRTTQWWSAQWTTETRWCGCVGQERGGDGSEDYDGFGVWLRDDGGGTE